MGFKVDTSFLRFVTMGALGARSVAAELRRQGFEPIVLERYSTSNKIWATKVKRLRLPDLLCVRTGLRVEVRAKSDLQIKMSDTPNNPDRAWDAGLRDRDVIALVACTNSGTRPQPAEAAVYFTARSLRHSVSKSKLGDPKSGSEGAERDRKWPSIVPNRPGRVISVDRERLSVIFEGDGQSARRYTYPPLNGKHAYVKVDDCFAAKTSILAGAPRSLANLSTYLSDTYDPIGELSSPNPLDRYAAARALRHRSELRSKTVPVLDARLGSEKETRVALEMAAAAAHFGSARGEDLIAKALWNNENAEMSMEAILILAELNTAFAYDLLRRGAMHEPWRKDERRQAAIWGLGKTGLRSYDDLLPYIDDPEENVAFHAIAGFGPDTPRSVIEKLAVILVQGDSRRAPAASEALRVIASTEVLDVLAASAKTNSGNGDWALATIGRLPPDMVRARLAGSPLLDRLAPMLLLAPGASWLANEDVLSNMSFLLKQEL